MNRTIQPAPVRKTVTVKTAPRHAFEVFTSGIGTWWPASHHIGVSPMKLSVIEPGDGTTRVDLEHRHLERMGDMAGSGRARLDAPDGWGLILSLYAQAADA